MAKKWKQKANRKMKRKGTQGSLTKARKAVIKLKTMTATPTFSFLSIDKGKEGCNEAEGQGKNKKASAD